MTFKINNRPTEDDINNSGIKTTKNLVKTDEGQHYYTPVLHSLGLDVNKEIPGEGVEDHNPSLEIKARVDEIFLLKEASTSKEIIPYLYSFYPKLVSYLTNFTGKDFEPIQFYLKELQENFELKNIQCQKFIRAYNGAIILNLIVSSFEEFEIDKIKLRDIFREGMEKESSRRNVLGFLYSCIQESIINKKIKNEMK